MYSHLLPRTHKRDYEAKPPMEHCPLCVPRSPRIAAVFSWLVYISDVACMLGIFATAQVS